MTFIIWCLIGYFVSLLPISDYVKTESIYDKLDYQMMTFFCWGGLWPLVLLYYLFQFMFKQAVKAMKGLTK